MNGSRTRDSLATTLAIASMAVITLAILGVALVVLLGVFSLIMGTRESAQSSWTLTVLLLSLSALSVPGIYFGLKHARGEVIRIPPAPSSSLWLLFALFPLVLALGSLVINARGLLTGMAPVMHVLAAAIPVLLVMMIVIRRGEPFSQARGWGSFLSGLWLSPSLALLLEISLAIPLLLILFLGNPDAFATPELLEGLAQSPGYAETMLLEQLNTLMKRPFVIAGILAYLSLAVPLIEEAAKVVGLLFLIRRKMTPALAFVGGSISGAAYGLFEAFFLAQPGADWTALMIARAGASVMHMFTAGLTGLGVYYGVKERRWGKMAARYAGAVVLHGTWNIAALGLGLGDLARAVERPIIDPAQSTLIGVVATTFLVLMTLAAAAGLWRYPHQLQQAQLELEAGGTGSD